jgi:hypothetical protein
LPPIPHLLCYRKGRNHHPLIIGSSNTRPHGAHDVWPCCTLFWYRGTAFWMMSIRSGYSQGRPEGDFLSVRDHVNEQDCCNLSNKGQDPKWALGEGGI